MPTKQDHHSTPPVPIRRWPESPPPPIGGTEVHGGRTLFAQPHLTLQLVRITAFEIGLNVHLALTAEGRSAVAARMQARPLTDARDSSARWSYLDVWIGTEQLAVADPYRTRPDVRAEEGGMCIYRTEPHYWIPVPPPTPFLTIATEWTQIGLEPVVTTLNLTDPAADHFPPSDDSDSGPQTADEPAQHQQGQ
ncbi:serine/threonine protein kinase [Rhodococcus sp. NPDC057014]|uniref:serine/threonine protein kinase n=1 Tax=Rhodococcus sp. NPDC057014 TaxID=3346000 RepID=UPI00363ABCF0